MTNQFNCICNYCGLFFKKRLAKMNSKKHFCSKFCFSAYRKPKIISCFQCSKETKNPKFCSISCSTRYNNTGKPSHNKKIDIIKPCINCGKNRINGNKYCSQKCQWDTFNKKLIEDWINGIFNGASKNGNLNSLIRRYLIKQSNYKCSLCNWGEKNIYSNNIPLEIDHIDGDWRNNSQKNLRVICPNCHSLTPTYKALNKTNHNRPIKVTRKKFKTKLVEAVGIEPAF